MAQPDNSTSAQSLLENKILARQQRIVKHCADQLAIEIRSDWEHTVTHPSAALGSERRRGHVVEDQDLLWWTKKWNDVAGPRELREIFSRISGLGSDNIPRPKFHLDFGGDGVPYRFVNLNDGRIAYQPIIEISYTREANQGQSDRPTVEICHKETLYLPSRWIDGGRYQFWYSDAEYTTHDDGSEETGFSFTSFSYVKPKGISIAPTTRSAPGSNITAQSGRCHSWKQGYLCPFVESKLELTVSIISNAILKSRRNTSVTNMPIPRRDSFRAETRRQTGEAIADAVAAHMLVYVTDRFHDFIRKKGTFEVSEERDCSQGIKEIVRKRYPDPLPYIEELGVCTRKLDVLDQLSTRRASPNARKGHVLRLLLTLQWKLPVWHENNPGGCKENPSEDKETYERIIVLPAKTELSQILEGNYTREWTISLPGETLDYPCDQVPRFCSRVDDVSVEGAISWRRDRWAFLSIDPKLLRRRSRFRTTAKSGITGTFPAWNRLGRLTSSLHTVGYLLILE
ncbi:hypothetical protein HD553DRAFT_321998 [Filobasidium floriforme]|uniref:uncharacterized protein n=1 Tax=Filobasidium floriforme TaxID=5210 RepID=UPI001E8E7679|nr:uncharacterized protein HD553DRAFT_321998 [Filobasidium floriforme]KAH8089138.1 hypothetical protein HD553DRAFT_321998 [Filobasidium floriforme]